MAYPHRPAQAPLSKQQGGFHSSPSAQAPLSPHGAHYPRSYGYDNPYYGDGGYNSARYGNQSNYPPPRPSGSSGRAHQGVHGRGPPNGQAHSLGYTSNERSPNAYGGRHPPPRVPRQGDRMRPPAGRSNRPPEAIGYGDSFPSGSPQDKRYPPPLESLQKDLTAVNLNGVLQGRSQDHSYVNSRRGPQGSATPVHPSDPGFARSVSADQLPGTMERPYIDPSASRAPHINRSATMPIDQEVLTHSLGYPSSRSAGSTRPDSQWVTDEVLDSYYEAPHPDDLDMPNFDAASDAQNSPFDESLPGLLPQKSWVPATSVPSASSTLPAPPAAAAKQYVAFTSQSFSALRPLNETPTGSSQSANAGFQFDIPNDTPRAGHGSYGDTTLAQFPSPGSYPHAGSVLSGGPPRPYRVNQPEANLSGPSGPSQPEPAGARGLDPQRNPDSLPYHPTPFRPGLDKPAPVRQYISPSSEATSSSSAVQDPDEANPVTHEELQQLQKMVQNNPSDYKKQLLLAQKLVEASTVLVDGGPSDSKAKTKAKEKYIMDAYKIVKKLTQNGYPDAQFYLADCYGKGSLGLHVDPKEAFALYHSAAKSGHAQSAYRAAVCCEIGHEEGGGTKRDPFKAVQWYKRAASLGDTPAMYKMGMILVKGLLGQSRSPREGVSWLKRAAERADPENPHALHELALMYSTAENDDIVIRDEEYALQLFHQAAELGYKFSQLRLGQAYEHGQIKCPVDPRQSIIYYTYAASQGEHQSELALSGWYLTGAEGILQQSDTEAYLWARKAATAGVSKAEYAMGYFSEVGIGTVANLDDAKRWYWRAAAQGLPRARERLEVLQRGGARMQKKRLSRSNVDRQNEADCVVM